MLQQGSITCFTQLILRNHFLRKRVGNAEKEVNRRNVGKALFIKCLHIGCSMGPTWKPEVHETLRTIHNPDSVRYKYQQNSMRIMHIVL